MNQEKIGKFISECRKKQNLTQQELADKLGITDKAVSKWECGKGLPDVSLYEPLCELLKISLNEFFAGKHLNQTELIKSSEKNILNLALEEKQTRKKVKKAIWASLIIGISFSTICFGLYKYVHNYMSTAKTFELNWEIFLPKDFKEDYYIDTGTTFHGDGQRYSIFKGTNFMTTLKEEKNLELEKEILKLYSSLKIPEEKQINFSHRYSWVKLNQKKDNQNYIYCIFDKEQNLFYFYEKLI